MLLDITSEQRQLLLDLIVSRIGEFHSEIRRCRIYDFRQGLKHDLDTLQSIQRLLDVPTCEASS